MSKEMPEFPLSFRSEIIKYDGKERKKYHANKEPKILHDTCTPLLDKCEFQELPSQKRISEFQDNCEEIANTLERMSSYISALRELSVRISLMGTNEDIDEKNIDVEWIKREEDRYRMQFFSRLGAIFRRVNKRTFSLFCEDFSLSDKQSIPYEGEVKIVVEGNAFYVKTPHLPNRNKHGIQKSMVDYFEIFAPAVEKKMRNIMDALPLFLEKNVDVLGVYPEGTGYIPDAENLDSKKIVDAITRPLLGGDSGECCSYSCKVICSDRLSPGTYFSVTEGFARTPSLASTIQILSSIFH